MFPAIIEDQCYVFVDTPGFNDADEGRTDVSVFLEILTWFHSMSTYCDLTGVLYVHDITSPRFSASAKTNLAFFQALCGKEFFQNVTIVTTMWRKLVPDAIEGTEDTQTELMEGPWKEMIDGHARVFEHRQGVIESKRPPTEPEKIKNLRDQRMEAHRELVEMMAYYQTSKTITPEIQHELRDKTGLLNTKAGMILLKASGFPPTPVQMGIDATSSSTIHVVHHVESPTAVTPPGANLSTQNNQAKKEGWWQNLVEAVSSFVWRK
jgi:hypothetical protein